MSYESVGNRVPLNHAIPGTASARVPAEWAAVGGLWRRMRNWWARILRFRLRQPRRLRLCESLPLGERRFVAVVEFEHSRFLLGGTCASLVLLARLDKASGEVQGKVQGEALSEDDAQPADQAAEISREFHD